MATRILVVNDTQEILDLFRILLEEEGYEVILSSYPLQTVSQVEQIAPALVILDLMFGDEKYGFQMLEMLKLSRSTTSIPVIVCTAALQAVREMEGYLVSKGVTLVYKPFDIDDLIKTVNLALEAHKNTLFHMKNEGDLGEMNS